MIARPDLMRQQVVTGIVLLTLGVLAIPLNLKGARRYQRGMDALDALGRSA